MRAFLCSAVVAVTLLGACTEITSDPTAIVALTFDSLPYPAVIEFDTLRDELGVARPLRALALNTDGRPIDGAAMSYLTPTGGVRITDGGYVISTESRTTPVSLVAQTNGLQSRAQALFVTSAPDSAFAESAVDTLRYALPDVASNVSGNIRVKVVNRGTTSPAAVRGWIVRYALEYRGTAVAPSDSVFGWLVDDGNRRSAEDTTGSDGIASRKVRVRVGNLVAPRDSVIVIATVRFRGSSLPGTPVRFVVPLVPR